MGNWLARNYMIIWVRKDGICYRMNQSWTLMAHGRNVEENISIVKLRIWADVMGLDTKSNT